VNDVIINVACVDFGIIMLTLVYVKKINVAFVK
jgi:hypothetical protein